MVLHSQLNLKSNDKIFGAWAENAHTAILHCRSTQPLMSCDIITYPRFSWTSEPLEFDHTLSFPHPIKGKNNYALARLVKGQHGL